MSFTKHMRENIEEIVAQAGVAVGMQSASWDCREHEDLDAEQMAYAMATNNWKEGHYGPMVTREEVMAAVKGAIDDIAIECHDCTRIKMLNRPRGQAPGRRDRQRRACDGHRHRRDR